MCVHVDSSNYLISIISLNVFHENISCDFLKNFTAENEKGMKINIILSSKKNTMTVTFCSPHKRQDYTEDKQEKT